MCGQAGFDRFEKVSEVHATAVGGEDLLVKMEIGLARTLSEDGGRVGVVEESIYALLHEWFGLPEPPVLK